MGALVGMARIMKGYHNVKKLQSRGYTLEEISQDFGVPLRDLQGFVNTCDGLASGNVTFALDTMDPTFLAKVEAIFA